MPHPAALPIDALLKECEVRHLRRSGPGGQHRNKVETAVALMHLPTGAIAEANERRSQMENQAVAVFRLRVRLALCVRSSSEENREPSELWKSRLGGGKIVVSQSHDDFPILLAEALDFIEACEADVKRAAETLGCSISQLVKFLKKEPAAMQLVNRRREEKGLHRLQ